MIKRMIPITKTISDKISKHFFVKENSLSYPISSNIKYLETEVVRSLRNEISNPISDILNLKRRGRNMKLKYFIVNV